MSFKLSQTRRKEVRRGRRIALNQAGPLPFEICRMRHRQKQRSCKSYPCARREIALSGMRQNLRQSPQERERTERGACARLKIPRLPGRGVRPRSARHSLDILALLLGLGQTWNWQPTVCMLSATIPGLRSNNATTRTRSGHPYPCIGLALSIAQLDDLDAKSIDFPSRRLRLRHSEFRL